MGKVPDPLLNWLVPVSPGLWQWWDWGSITGPRVPGQKATEEGLRPPGEKEGPLAATRLWKSLPARPEGLLTSSPQAT